MISLIRGASSVLLLLLTACGTFEISLERTSTPGIASTGAVLPQAQNRQLPTESVALKTPALALMPPPQPTPADVLGGGTVFDGPFIFDLRLFRDPSFNRGPVATSLYSDLDGFGAWMYWFYNGADPIGPIETMWGTVLPDGQAALSQLLQESHPVIRTGNSGGRDGGILLPGGFFMPGQSKVGDRVRVVMKVVTPDAEYGAVLAFSLRQGLNGFEPVGISVDTLKSLATSTP